MADTDISPILQDLRRTLAWVDRAHEYWLSGKSYQHTNADFAEGLARVDEGERLLRSLGYRGCVTEAGQCGLGSVLTCDACMPKAAEADVGYISDEALPSEEGRAVLGLEAVTEPPPGGALDADLRPAPTDQMLLFSMPIEEGNATDNHIRKPRGATPARRARK